jgi:hypothetical protein
MKVQKIPNSQGNPEQKEQSWGYHNTWVQFILQSYRNKNSMALAQEQTHRPIKWNKRSRNKPTQIVIWLLTKEQKACVGEKTAPSTNGAWKTGYPHTGDWNPISHSVQKPIQNGSMILIKTWKFETTTGKHR